MVKKRAGRCSSRFYILISIGLIASLAAITVLLHSSTFNPNPFRKTGEVVDSLHGVDVYFNGGTRHTNGRNLSPDGYNIGLRYQCVEFTKRYYLDRFGHRMPYTYGDAKDFFEEGLKDGELNTARGLLQYQNPSKAVPKVGDLIVYRSSLIRPRGHVAIVSRVSNEGTKMEIVQQNSGPFGASRRTYSIEAAGDRWRILNCNIVGWLRLR